MNKIEFLIMNFGFGRKVILDGVVSRLKRVSKLPINQKSLEIGCGNGIGTQLFFKYFSPSSIVATDLDEKLVKIAKKDNKNPKIIFEVGDATKLKYDDNEFDAVFGLSVIHHIPKWKDSLNELKRVIRPKGKLILKELSAETFETLFGRIAKKIVYHPYDDMFEKKEFVDYLKKIGFKTSYFKSFYPWHQTRYFLIVAEKEK